MKGDWAEQKCYWLQLMRLVCVCITCLFSASDSMFHVMWHSVLACSLHQILCSMLCGTVFLLVLCIRFYVLCYAAQCSCLFSASDSMFHVMWHSVLACSLHQILCSMLCGTVFLLVLCIRLYVPCYVAQCSCLFSASDCMFHVMWHSVLACSLHQILCSVLCGTVFLLVLCIRFYVPCYVSQCSCLFSASDSMFYVMWHSVLACSLHQILCSVLCGTVFLLVLCIRFYVPCYVAQCSCLFSASDSMFYVMWYSVLACSLHQIVCSMLCGTVFLLVLCIRFYVPCYVAQCSCLFSASDSMFCVMRHSVLPCSLHQILCSMLCFTVFLLVLCIRLYVLCYAAQCSCLFSASDSMFCVMRHSVLAYSLHQILCSMLCGTVFLLVLCIRFYVLCYVA